LSATVGLSVIHLYFKKDDGAVEQFFDGAASGVAWPELAPAMGGRVVELLHGPVPAGIICDGKELVKGRAHQGGGARRAAVLDRGEEERERERRRR
jgi:hypothetical protein